MPLTWDEIFSQEPTTDYRQLFEQWNPPRVIGQVQPIGMSAFGDVYFLRPDGSVHVLDIFEGSVTQVAQSYTEFGACMNSTEWRDEHLMPEVVLQLQRRGLARGPGQVFAFAPHPAFVGRLDPDRALVLDAVVWHSICAQTLGSDGAAA